MVRGRGMGKDRARRAGAWRVGCSGWAVEATRATPVGAAVRETRELRGW